MIACILEEQMPPHASRLTDEKKSDLAFKGWYPVLTIRHSESPTNMVKFLRSESIN